MMRFLAIALVVLLVFAAASVVAAYAFGRFAEAARGAPSHALSRDGAPTVLDAYVDGLRKGHDAESGLVLVSSNLDAFAARALSARIAGRSLDLMYYIWNDDLTGRLILREALAAADRGVRVRLLLDDIGVSLSDKTFLAVDSHPLIEVRLFNPTHARENPISRGIEMALRMVSVNRRMHNKAWIADGQIAIVGGRNIGDEYFDAAEASNFRDLDLIAIGEMAGQAEVIFDEYWNSGLALPVRALAERETPPLDGLRQAFRRLAETAPANPYIKRLRERLTVASLFDDADVHWTQEARLVSDPAEKAAGKSGRNALLEELVPLLASSERQLNISSPYFIPGDEGARFFSRLVEKGVDVTVLTNSLAATDVAAVHGGYAPYREPLLRSGVNLFELKPTAASGGISLRGSSQASLHTKAFTSDGTAGFVGSLNFDPRSVSLNTEMGVLFAVPALVAEMDRIFAEEISPAMSYRVTLDADGDLIWSATESGVPVQLTQEPEASLGRRILATVVGWLPLESQL